MDWWIVVWILLGMMLLLWLIPVRRSTISSKPWQAFKTSVRFVLINFLIYLVLKLSRDDDKHVPALKILIFALMKAKW